MTATWQHSTLPSLFARSQATSPCQTFDAPACNQHCATVLSELGRPGGMEGPQQRLALRLKLRQPRSASQIAS